MFKFRLPSNQNLKAQNIMQDYYKTNVMIVGSLHTPIVVNKVQIESNMGKEKPKQFF